MSVTYGHDKVCWDAPPIKSVAELVELINVGLPPERSAILTAFPIRTQSYVHKIELLTLPRCSYATTCLVPGCIIPAYRAAHAEARTRVYGRTI